VKEIDTTECASDDWVHLLASILNLELSIAANVREDISLAQFNQNEFSVVGVCRVILQTVGRSSQ
jgi:hypothetical protein